MKFFSLSNLVIAEAFIFRFSKFIYGFILSKGVYLDMTYALAMAILYNKLVALFKR